MVTVDFMVVGVRGEEAWCGAVCLAGCIVHQVPGGLEMMTTPAVKKAPIPSLASKFRMAREIEAASYNQSGFNTSHNLSFKADCLARWLEIEVLPVEATVVPQKTGGEEHREDGAGEGGCGGQGTGTGEEEGIVYCTVTAR